ncbi:MAG TPA: ribosomal protein S18-alanine N-acetyltransferase [Pyrinomonadaceae bacterium]|jgi:ribosomal-protein-alanine N-acetyltransferase|nr:ribosomal protein S18-alanine N-acetyltransferase [Pyrinomonadaceae bacterium]
MSSTESTRRVTIQDFNISRMTEHDLLAVVEIEETCGLSRWGWDAYHNEIAEGRGALMLVARSAVSSADKEGEGGPLIVGFIAARFTAGEVHINNVAVRHAFRRRGIGAALLERALAEGARRGARTALLEVRAGNTAAQALYARLGFRITGRRKGYYTEPPEDALVMNASI